MFRTLGFTLSTLGSVPSNVFKVPKTTVNTFDGTDPKVDRIKPKVRNTFFFLSLCSGTTLLMDRADMVGTSIWRRALFGIGCCDLFAHG